MLFDQNRVDAIIHNWKNQVFPNERIHGVPLRRSTCLKPPIGGFRNLASSKKHCLTKRQLSHMRQLGFKLPGERQHAVSGNALDHTAIGARSLRVEFEMISDKTTVFGLFGSTIVQ